MGVLNYKLLIEYDGTAFHGWQIQRATRTAQGDLEAALREATGRDQITLYGAGRTDAGVHARGQVANVKLETTLSPDELRGAINSRLESDIRVQALERAPDDYNARFSAVRRRYSYTISTGRPVLGRQYLWSLKYPVGLEPLMECGDLVSGEHDFSGFSKANQDVASTVCFVETSRWERSGEHMVYHITADRFLQYMVRCLVGTMVDVARGRFAVVDFQRRLEEGRGPVIPRRAPAAGLVLEEVKYQQPDGEKA